MRYIDSVIIGMYLPLASVGVYAIAALIPTVIEAPLAAIEKISNPAIAKEWENGNIKRTHKSLLPKYKIPHGNRWDSFYWN